MQYSSPSTQKTSGMAIASLVCSILGVVTCVTGPVGLILGIVALVRINKSKGSLVGNGMAIAGIVVGGVVSLLLVPIMAALLLPAFSKAKSRAELSQCINNMRQIQIALRMYAMEHDGQFPPATSWCDAIKDDVPANVFKCRSEPDLECAYALNSNLGGTNTSTFPDTVLLFSSREGWNASGTAEILQAHVHSPGQFIIGLEDGSVQVIRAQDSASLKW